jgi:hypothetical protein
MKEVIMFRLFIFTMSTVFIFLSQVSLAAETSSVASGANHLRLVCQSPLEPANLQNLKIPPRIIILEQLYTNERSGTELIDSIFEFTTGGENIRFRATFSNDTTVNTTPMNAEQLREASDRILAEARDRDFNDSNSNDPNYMSGSIEGTARVGHGFLRFQEEGGRNFAFTASTHDVELNWNYLEINRGEGYSGSQFGYNCNSNVLAIEASSPVSETDGATYGTGVSY